MEGQDQQEYEIHYGLAQKWKRSIDQGVDFFLHELADFVRTYNEENAKRQEKKKPTRDAIAQGDLDTVLSTIISGEVDARTVCLLLLAYGYSMTPDEGHVPMQPVKQSEPAETPPRKPMH